MTFEASDGVKLSGWYRPSANGATVIVVHGGGSDRRGSVAHASLLARHGYGVLLYDARGRGRSDGRQNAWGWGWKQRHRGRDRVPEGAARGRPASGSARSASPAAPTRWSRWPGRAAT